jgi:hypothetical protein
MKTRHNTQKRGGSREGLDVRVKDGLEIQHRKQIYLVWYKYVQFLYTNKKITIGKKSFKYDDKYYKDWKLKTGEKFDIWWTKNWKRLFSEPTRGIVNKVSSIPSKKSPDSIYIEVPLNSPPHVLESKCKQIIDQEFKHRKIDPRKTFQSKALFQPDLTIRFDVPVWLRRLVCIELQIKGTIRRQIARDRKVKFLRMTEQEYKQKRKDYGIPEEVINAERLVSLDISKGLKLLKMVEKGKFSNKFK